MSQRYILSEQDRQIIADLKRRMDQLTVQLDNRRRYPLTAAGKSIRKAYVKTAPGAVDTVDCYLGFDDDGATAYNSTATYARDAVVSYGSYHYRSTLDNNRGNSPDSSSAWARIPEITVTCEISRGSALNAAAPRLVDGDLIYVIKDGDTWRTIWPFIATENC